MIVPLKLVWRHKLIIYEALPCSAKSDRHSQAPASEYSAFIGWVID